MATKTISVRVDAYERLTRARKSPSESFSDVIMRARWEHEPTTAAAYLKLVRERGPVYGAAALKDVERVKREDRPPGNKWKRG